MAFEIVASAYTGDTTTGVAVDSEGNIFVVGDRINLSGTYKNVWKYNSTLTVELGSADTGSDNNGVAIDSMGNVFIVGDSSGGANVWKYDNDLETLLGSAYTDTPLTYCIAINSSDEIYVGGYYFYSSDIAQRKTVWKYNNALTYSPNQVYTGQKALGIAIDSAGNVYIGGSSHSGENLHKYNSDLSTELASAFTGGFWTNLVYGVSVDSLNNIFVVGVCDEISSPYRNVWKYSSSLNLLGYAYTTCLDTSNSTEGVSVDTAGHVYVAGSRNQDDLGTYKSVWKFDGTLNPLASTDTGSYTYSITTDSSGNVYVAGSSSDASGTDKSVWKIQQDSPTTNMPPAPTDPIWSRPNVCPDNPFTVLGVELADETIPYPLDGDYELTEDIVLNPMCGHPAGTEAAPFTGTFDGKGFSISGCLRTDGVYSDYFGLFGVTVGATIKNFVFDNLWIDMLGHRYLDSDDRPFPTCGMLIGKADSTTIENIDIIGVTGENSEWSRAGTIIYATENAGGVVGYALNGTTLTNVTSSQVSCSTGITGACSGNLVARGDNITITDCHIDSTQEYIMDTVVTSSGSYSGGLVGHLTDSTVTQSSSSVRGVIVHEEAMRGGFIGYSENNTISKCTVEDAMKFDNTTQIGLFAGLCHNNNSFTDCIYQGGVWNVFTAAHSFDYFGKSWMGAFCNTMTSDTPTTIYTTFNSCVVFAYGSKDTIRDAWASLGASYTSYVPLEAPADNLIKVIDTSIPKASVFNASYVVDTFCKENTIYPQVALFDMKFGGDADTFPKLDFVNSWVEATPLIRIRSTTDFQNTSVSRWLSAQATPADSWELALSNTTMTSADNCMVVGNQTYLFQTNVARAATGTPNILTRYVGTTADLTIAVGQTTGDFAYWSQIEAMSYDDDYIYVLVDKVSSGLYIEKIDFNLAAGSRIISSTAVVLDSAEDIIEGGNRTSHLFVGNDYVNAYVVVSPTKIYYKLLFDTDLSLIRSWKYDKKQELLAIATLES